MQCEILREQFFFFCEILLPVLSAHFCIAHWGNGFYDTTDVGFVMRPKGRAPLAQSRHLLLLTPLGPVHHCKKKLPRLVPQQWPWDSSCWNFDTLINKDLHMLLASLTALVAQLTEDCLMIMPSNKGQSELNCLGFWKKVRMITVIQIQLHASLPSKIWVQSSWACFCCWGFFVFVLMLDVFWHLSLTIFAFWLLFLSLGEFFPNDVKKK